MTDFENWARKPETKARLATAKKNAWEKFTKQFPNADKNQFQVQTSVDEKYRISAEVFFNGSEGSSVSVFGSDRKYWSQKMKTALGLAGLEGFPYQLSPLKTKIALPLPAVDFTEPRDKHRQNLQSREQNLRDSRRVLRNKIPRHIPERQANAQSIGGSKKMVRRPKHGLLAATTEFCDVLRDAGMWNFT